MWSLVYSVFQQWGHCIPCLLLPKDARTEHSHRLVLTKWNRRSFYTFCVFWSSLHGDPIAAFKRCSHWIFLHCFILTRWNQRSFYTLCVFQSSLHGDLILIPFWLAIGQSAFFLYLLCVSIKSSRWSDSDSFLARHWSISVLFIPFVCFNQVFTVIWFWFLSGSPLVNQVAGACWTWWTWTHRRGWRCRWRSGCATTRTLSVIACSTSSVWSSATRVWRTTWSLPPWFVFHCWSFLCSATVHYWADSLHSHVILHEWLAFYSVFLNSHWSGVLTHWCHMKLLPSWNILCTPYKYVPCHFVQNHVRSVYAYLAVTCHLHFWQNDQDLLQTTPVTRGWNGYQNKSEKKFDRGVENSPTAPGGTWTPGPFNPKSHTLTTELFPLPRCQTDCFMFRRCVRLTGWTECGHDTWKNARQSPPTSSTRWSTPKCRSECWSF